VIKREVTFEVDGLEIVGQLYLPDESAALHPAVCICHGIPNDTPAANTKIRDRGYAGLAEEICRQGFTVLIFNFRGTGGSQGNFDILGWTDDLRAALDYLWALPGVCGSGLSLLGFSGGAAVAVCVAGLGERVSAVAACACPAEFDSLVVERGQSSAIIDHFRSIGVIRDKDFPASPEDWLDGFRRVSPINYVSRISPRPLLLVHGDQDETVTLDHAHRLYAQAKEPKQLVIIDGVGHQLRRDERAVAIVTRWLKSQAGAQ
jgi:putative redox protein